VPSRFARFCPISLRALTAAALLAGAVAATAAEDATGRLVGRVRLVAARSTQPLAIAYASRTLTTPGTPNREIRNVVVYLGDVPPTPVAPRRHEMRQQNELFVPHVLPIARGASVAFPNVDPYFHNVFSLSRAARFDLGRYPRGESRVRTFDRPGLVKVFCHLHSEMSAVILVLDHPWFTTPDDEGAFVIEGVPAGARTVTAWHERIGEARTRVDVPAGGEATVEFVLPVVES
jgi:plastocyanin